MVQNVLCHIGDAAVVLQRLLFLDTPYLVILHVLLLLHGGDVCHTEFQHVVVSDGIHDGVGMQTLAKNVFGGFQRTLARSGDVFHEDWRTGKTEEVVFLESLGDGGVHVAKLRAVALVEYHDHLLAVDVVVGVLLDEVGELL